MAVAPFPASIPLAAAPHRLLFFIGAANVLAAMAWWTGWLGGMLPTPTVPAGWMHAFIMQYQVLPTFIFGFLLTVFPRWMAQTDASGWHYLPVGLGLVLGQVLTLAGLALRQLSAPSSDALPVLQLGGDFTLTAGDGLKIAAVDKLQGVVTQGPLRALWFDLPL